MTNLLAYLGAGIVGICVALEPTINSGLGKVITPRLAVLHSFLTGAAIALIVNLLAGGFKEYRLITGVSPFYWIGGLIGLVVVFLGARVAPVIGIASTITIMVVVQLLTGLFIDHFGLLGTPRVRIDVDRVFGALLLVAAVKLIVR